MYQRCLAALALALTVSAAHAADPTGVITSSGTVPLPTFEEFTGPAVVGNGSLNLDTLFYIDEQTGALGKSWYIFYEPAGNGDKLSATITFDSAITGVLSLTTDLMATDAIYGRAGITYDDVTLTGLEATDAFSFAGNVLTLDIRSFNPGDHIRVFTAVTPAVPEPSSYALLAGSLCLMAAVMRRRRL
jgi:hypothetical protein